MGKPYINAEMIKLFVDGKEIEQRSVIHTGMMQPKLEWTTVKDLHVFAYDHLEFRIKPAREYPKTSLSASEIMSCVKSTPGDYLDSYFSIANAAIRRYIEDQENKECI